VTKSFLSRLGVAVHFTFPHTCSTQLNSSPLLSLTRWCVIYILKVTVTVSDGWAGRFWGRTGCGFDGNGQGPCATGDCGNILECNGAGGVPPATLAEVTLNGDAGKDFYDISLVDGFNVPMQVRKCLE
jgi:hypothetical protein